MIHIGAGPLQVDSIKWAKELGIHVIVTDKNPDAPALKYADEYYPLSGNDTPNLLKLAIRAAQKFEIIAAYSSSDFGVLPVAAIHKELGLNGCPPEVVKLTLDKYRSKRIWQKKNINTPKAEKIFSFDEIKDELDKLHYPLIIKPIDSCGSQGVKSVDGPDEVSVAVNSAFSFSSEILVEEYIDGKGYDTIGIVWDGKFIPCGIGNRFFSAKPYHFPLYGFTPCDLEIDEIKMAYKITERAALSLGINYAPVKADLLYKNNTFYVIEVAPRFHGDVFTSKLIPFSHQTSPVKKLFELQTRFKIDLSYQPRTQKRVAWRAIFPQKVGIDFEAMEKKLKKEFCILDFFYKKSPNISTNEHHDNTTLLGFFWVGFDSINELTTFNDKFYDQFGDILL